MRYAYDDGSFTHKISQGEKKEDRGQRTPEF
jgi:hypothetical protein